MLDWQVILHLNFTIKSSFFNEIDYWTWSDFWKQFRHGSLSNTKTIVTSICKGNTMSKTTIREWFLFIEWDPIKKSLYGTIYFILPTTFCSGANFKKKFLSRLSSLPRTNSFGAPQKSDWFIPKKGCWVERSAGEPEHYLYTDRVDIRRIQVGLGTKSAGTGTPSCTHQNYGNPLVHCLACLFVCLLLNGTSAQFRLLLPIIVELEHMKYVKNDL